jgi:hypothetical protein
LLARPRSAAAQRGRAGQGRAEEAEQLHEPDVVRAHRLGDVAIEVSARGHLTADGPLLPRADDLHLAVALRGEAQRDRRRRLGADHPEHDRDGQEDQNASPQEVAEGAKPDQIAPAL